MVTVPLQLLRHFEATFIADGTFVAIDVLEKQGDGYRLTEVKSSTSQQDEHIPDVAVQARVAAARGVNVTAAEVLHLNKEFRHPDVGDLFAWVPPLPQGEGARG